MSTLSSGYSQSASLLAHNQITASQFIRRACTPPDTSKSPPTAYCFSQLKQGTYLIWLNFAFSNMIISRYTAREWKGSRAFLLSSLFSLLRELKTLSSHDWSRVLPDALGVRLNIGGYACNLGQHSYAHFPMPDMAGSHIAGSPLYICLHLCRL